MNIGDKNRRKIRLGHAFINDPSYNGRSRYVPDVVINKTYKIIYMKPGSDLFWTMYFGEDVCTYEYCRDVWHTGIQASPRDRYDPTKESLRTLIYSQAIPRHVFNEELDVWDALK